MKVLVLLVLFFAFAGQASARTWPEKTTDPVLQRSSAQILASLEPEPISCLAQSEWTFPTTDEGWVWFGQPHIYVRDFVCEDLVRVAQGTLPADNTTAEFAKLVAHEHAHVLGVTDESQAECAGVRGAPAILEKLGVPADKAGALAAQIVPFYPLPSGC